MANTAMYLVPMILIICYLGSENLPDVGSTNRGAIIGVIIMQVIMIIPNAVSSAQLLSVPFAVLKNIVDSTHFGLFVGLFNSAIIVAQIITYGITYFLFHKMYEPSDNSGADLYYDNSVSIIISSIIPVVFYFISSFVSIKIKKAYKQRIEYSHLRQNGDELIENGEEKTENVIV